MAVFSVSFVIVLANRTLLNGAFGYIALVSGLLGIAALLFVKLFYKEEGTPAYLPKPNGDADEAAANEPEASGQPNETESSEANEKESQDAQS